MKLDKSCSRCNFRILTGYLFFTSSMERGLPSPDKHAEFRRRLLEEEDDGHDFEPLGRRQSIVFPEDGDDEEEEDEEDEDGDDDDEDDEEDEDEDEVTEKKKEKEKVMEKKKEKERPAPVRRAPGTIIAEELKEAWRHFSLHGWGAFTFHGNPPEPTSANVEGLTSGALVFMHTLHSGLLFTLAPMPVRTWSFSEDPMLSELAVRAGVGKVQVLNADGPVLLRGFANEDMEPGLMLLVFGVNTDIYIRQALSRKEHRGDRIHLPFRLTDEWVKVPPLSFILASPSLEIKRIAAADDDDGPDKSDGFFCMPLYLVLNRTRVEAKLPGLFTKCVRFIKQYNTSSARTEDVERKNRGTCAISDLIQKGGQNALPLVAGIVNNSLKYAKAMVEDGYVYNGLIGRLGVFQQPPFPETTLGGRRLLENPDTDISSIMELFVTTQERRMQLLRALLSADACEGEETDDEVIWSIICDLVKCRTESAKRAICSNADFDFSPLAAAGIIESSNPFTIDRKDLETVSAPFFGMLKPMPQLPPLFASMMQAPLQPVRFGTSLLSLPPLPPPPPPPPASSLLPPPPPTISAPALSYELSAPSSPMSASSPSSTILIPHPPSPSASVTSGGSGRRGRKRTEPPSPCVSAPSPPLRKRTRSATSSH